MTIRARFALSLVVCVASLLLASAVQAQSPQDVWTWHNDNNRTGWQPQEQTLTPAAVGTPCNPASSTGFCLLWQYAGTQQTPMGRVLAQPLAVGNLSGVTGCSSTCNLVFIADDQDNIWAYDATSSNLIWNINLADVAGGDPINCSSLAVQYPGFDFGPCDQPNYPGNTIGVIGTPVVDTNAKILYVVAPIFSPVPPSAGYDLFAISITNPTNTYWTPISGSVTGNNPGQSDKCADGSNSGSIPFTSYHLQRSALLLLTQSGTPTVYIAFAPGGTEWENGWLFGYTLNGTTLTRTSMFVTTPNGTGGGIWGSGAGPASDGKDIYVTTGNGTFDYNTQTQTSGPDYGDSVLRLGTTANANGVLPIKDSFTPADVYNYREPNPPTGLCPNDVDLGSVGILIFPDAFYGDTNLMVSADKQSNLYFENLANMGQFNPNGVTNNNTETILTPNSNNNALYPQANQGYWSNPAYWKYVSAGTSYYELFYGVQTDPGNNFDFGEAPYPIYQYTLSPTVSSQGPLSASVNASAISTPDLFCFFSPTPSVSSYNNTGGVLWAIENQNKRNPTDCSGNQESIALHAYDATNISNLLYASSGNTGVKNHELGKQVAFPVPTVFNGRVYAAGGGMVNGVGAGVVNVFGMCNEGMSGTCPNPQ